MNNILCERLNIAYPIIQAPMAGVSTPEMAAAVNLKPYNFSEVHQVRNSSWRDSDAG